VTSAGLVFAVTMASMLGSSLIIVAQFGSTIAIGLLLDTLIVRTLLMPSIATLLGRWFWWPQVVYPRGDHNVPATSVSAHSPVANDAAISRDGAQRDDSAVFSDRPLGLGTTSHEGQQ
jgi:putative drug exporter of the RND superfamily